MDLFTESKQADNTAGKMLNFSEHHWADFKFANAELNKDFVTIDQLKNSSSSAAALLPSLGLDHLPQPEAAPVEAVHPGFLQEAWNVTKELGKGALNELTEHPVELAVRAGTGLLAGTALALTSPEILAGAALASVVVVGYEAYQAVKHWDEIVHNTEVVADPAAYSAAEVAKASAAVRDFGGGALEVGAGLAGGLAGSRVGAGLARLGIAVDLGFPSALPEAVESAAFKVVPSTTGILFSNELWDLRNQVYGRVDSEMLK
ncbi:MAG: hypothetical protein JST01_20700 [Cyanobacteria bacterium SZAS TMP-1]|nr:hypothetical protein [Cyanobacteria bacterium SZAS TMP-1]